MKTEIGTYEAKTRLPELLRAVKAGKRFTITSRGEPVAELVPVAAREFGDAATAIDVFRAFRSRHPVSSPSDIRALIDEGRA
jgi:prevent-host-death family protein